MNQSRVNEIKKKFIGKGTDATVLYTNQEVVDRLRDMQRIMLNVVFEKTHAKHMRDKDILRHFSSLAEEYGLKETETFKRFEINMNEMSYIIGTYIKGMKGEHIAHRALKLLSFDFGVEILYNIALEDEDAQTEYDAIIVTPYGLFIVEVKNWGEKIFINEKGLLVREDKDITYNLADRMNLKEGILKSYLGDLFPMKYQGFLLFPSGNVKIEDIYKKVITCQGAGIVDEIRKLNNGEVLLSSLQIKEIVRILKMNHNEQRSICTVKCDEIIEDYATIMAQIEERLEVKIKEKKETEELELKSFIRSRPKINISSEKIQKKKEEIPIPNFLLKDVKEKDGFTKIACTLTGVIIGAGLGVYSTKTFSRK